MSSNRGVVYLGEGKVAVGKRTEATRIKLKCLRGRFRHMQRIPRGRRRDRHHYFLRPFQFRRYRGIRLNDAYRSLRKFSFYPGSRIAFHRDVSRLGGSAGIPSKIESGHRDRPF